MSNPKKTELYTARRDTGRLMTHSTGLILGERSRSESSETEMPSGNMNGGSDLTSSEMPSGQMVGTASPPGSTSGFPASSMTGSAGLAESEMPTGQMAGAQSGAMGTGSGTDVGLTVTEMPSGYIQAESGQVEEKESDSFPVLEITGEWLLTLSPNSLKKSKGN